MQWGAFSARFSPRMSEKRSVDCITELHLVHPIAAHQAGDVQHSAAFHRQTGGLARGSESDRFDIDFQFHAI